MSATAAVLPVAVPDIGDFGEVPVIEILVSVGDTVAVEDPLVTLESDKATMDVPSPAAGVVKAIHVKLGDKVTEGSVLVDLEASGEGAGASDSSSGVLRTSSSEPDAPTPASAGTQDAPPAAPAAVSAPVVAPAAAPAPAAAGGLEKAANGNGSSTVYASPSVRKLARELAVDLHGITGSGRKGRVIAQDVRSGGLKPAGGAVPTNGSGAGLNLAPWPTVDFEKFGEVERVQRSRIQKISAPNLARKLGDDPPRHPQRRGRHH